MELPETRISKFVDPTLLRIATWAGYIWVLLMAVIVVNVVFRYGFGEGRIEFEEIQWHLYSTGFLLVLGYGVVSDTHIRVDVFHERFSNEVQAWIDLYGLILFVLPFSILIIYFGVPFVAYSFEVNEVSAAPGGLPFRWMIKAMLVLGMALLALGTISRISRLYAYLRDHAG